MRRMYSEEQVKKLALEGLVGQDVQVKSLTSDGGAIIEGMSGYSIEKFTPATMTIQNVYVGAVKNGNKITLVWFGTLTPTSVEGNFKSVIRFNLPSDVGAKIYPYTLGAFDNIVFATIVNGYSSLTSVTDIQCILRKSSDVIFTLQVRDTNLTPNTTYYCRFEATFLLSDNMAE